MRARLCFLILIGLASALVGCASLPQNRDNTTQTISPQTMAPSPVCAITIETVKHVIPAGNLPTITVKVDDPVVVRLWSYEPNPHVLLTVAAERAFVTPESAVAADSSAVRIVHSLPADSTQRDRNNVASHCLDTPLYYSDVVIDDALGNRSRVYHLAVEFGSDPTGNTETFALNVQRYRPVYVELATGPLLTFANMDEYTLERPAGDSISAVLSERQASGRTSLALGAILRPWGANPYTAHGRGWLRNTGFYVSSPVTSDFAKAFSVGVAMGAHGMTLVGGAHFRTAAVPIDGITPGVPFTPRPGLNALEDVTRTRLRFGGFVGVQLDLNVFARLFSSGASTATP